MNRADRRRHRSRCAATFEVVDRPDLAPDAKQFILDCSHSRTFTLSLPGPAGHPSAAQQLALLLGKRSLVGERCNCTAEIERRYRPAWPSSVGPVLWVNAEGGA
jgi:hypothetical protein